MMPPGTRIRRNTRTLLVVAAMALILLTLSNTPSRGGIPDQFVLGNVAYTVPKGALADRLFNPPPAVGLSLGYLYAPNRNIQLGAVGSWMHFRSTVVFDIADSLQTLPETETTVLQMLAVARFRLLKHGFSPYADLEAGMCFLSHIEQVRPCLAAAIGVQIPVSDVVDIDLKFRTSWAPMANDELLIHGVHAGLVYALPR